MLCGRECIAIVDDDRGICRALARLLRSAGFDVRTFESAEEFLGHAATERHDCLILDINLPGMSGIELSRRLDLEEKHPPTIFITAMPRDWESAQTGSAARSICLHKPFSDSLLLGAVRTALSCSSQ
jgi:FixJ family two-component response regulator